MNKFNFFTPLMHYKEYKLIEKYLDKNDILLEWGSGNGTIYFSGLVKKIITIEHDKFYWDRTEIAIKTYNIKNIDNILIQSKSKLIPNKENRYEVFEEYINYPKNNNLYFDKVLIDGRGRKYCALSILDMINANNLVFIHDFNFNNVEGYEDEDYFNDILNKYDIVERVLEGRGIVALKKKI